MWIHFHGIDDAGHSYGPARLRRLPRSGAVDGYVGEILAALPERTLVLIVADHGMHSVEEDGRSKPWTSDRPRYVDSHLCPATLMRRWLLGIYREPYRFMGSFCAQSNHHRRGEAR